MECLKKIIRYLSAKMIDFTFRPEIVMIPEESVSGFITIDTLIPTPNWYGLIVLSGILLQK